jgi:bacteriorhodopsin
MNSIVLNATKTSLIVQAITGAVGIYGLTIPISPKHNILRQILGLELIVQVIEFIFYLNFLSAPTIQGLTEKRYYDWFLSTPVMLFTIALYFFYVNFIEEDCTNTITITDFLKSNIKQVTLFVILNFLMLLFGYLAEIGLIDKYLAFILGSLALIGSFYIIYDNYGKYSEKTKNVFWIMFGLWSMYGIAFLFPPVPKNLGYTVLDIFSKNFFGIFLFYMIKLKEE